MTWNKRAKYAIGKHKESLLVYITDESQWRSSQDVFVKLMFGAKKILQGEMGLLPIVYHWNAKREPDVEPLQEIFRI